MGDQEQGMEKVSGGGGGRRKKGLSIPAKDGCGAGAGVGVGVGVSVGVAILVFGTAVDAFVRARRARHEDRTTNRSFGEDEDNERIEREGKIKEEETEQEEEENASFISQRREEMSEEIEETSFQIDPENQYFCGKPDLNPKEEDTEIVTIEEEEIILKASNDGDCDHKNSEESKVIPTEIKIFEEANKEEEEEEEQEQEEDSAENEKADCEATIESSIKETVDGSNDDSRASLIESGVFEAVVEAIERENEEEKEEIEKRIANTSKTENDLSGNKREVEWKLEDDVKKVSREEPKEIEISNTTKTIVMMHENAIGFAITNRTKGGLLMISAFVLTIVLLLFVRRDHLGVFQLSTM